MKRVAVWLSLLALGSCSPASVQPSAPEAPPHLAPPSPSPSASAGPVVNPAPDAASRRVRAMLDRVSRLRSLPVRGDVRAATIDRATMVAQLKQNLREQIPAEVVHGQGEFLRAFGFLPPDYDFEAGLFRLLEGQLAGYYDPDLKAMFLMDDLSSSEADATLAHELVHALQDQHYDLAPRMRYRPDANDAQSALQSLAEGDATSAMMDYLLAEQGGTAEDLPDAMMEAQIAAGVMLSPELASCPGILRNSLMSPYLDGVRLVHALRRRGGWAAVDRVWQTPPATTEQLLHLDKLDAREAPEAVPPPSIEPLGPGWSVAYADVYGEQGVRLAFEEWMPRRVAARAAQGWAGDRAVLATSTTGTRRMAAWRIRFDPHGAPPARSGEAREAFDAIVAAWGDAKKGAREVCHPLPGGTALFALIRDRDVALVAAPAATDSSPTSSSCAVARRWAAAIVSSR